MFSLHDCVLTTAAEGAKYVVTGDIDELLVLPRRQRYRAQHAEHAEHAEHARGRPTDGG